MADTSEEVNTAAPLCCGGGDFYGHESFCDCGHVLAEEAIGTVLKAVASLLSNLGGTYDRPTASELDIQRLQRAWDANEYSRTRKVGSDDVAPLPR